MKMINFYFLLVFVSVNSLWANNKEYFQNRDDFFIPPAKIINKVILTPDEKKIIVKSNNALYYWDIKEGKIVKIIKHKRKSNETLYWFQLESALGGNKIVGTLLDMKSLTVLDKASGKVLNSFSNEKNYIDKFAISKDGEVILITSREKLSLWKSGKKRELNKYYQKEKKPISAVALNKNGTKIFIAYRDGNISVIDAKLEKKIFSFKEENGNVLSLLVTNDERYIVCHTYKSITIWDIQTGKLVEKFIENSENFILNIEISADTNKIIYVLSNQEGTERSIVLWDRKKNSKKSFLKDKKYQVRSIALGKHKKKIFVGSSDGNVFVFDIKTETVLKTLKGHQQLGLNVLMLDDNKKVFTSSAYSRVLWDINNSKVINYISSNEKLIADTISKNGEIAALASSKYIIKIWNRKTKKILLALERKEKLLSYEFPTPIKLSDNGNIAVVAMENMIIMWERESGKVSTLKGHKEDINSMSLSKDGKTIISQEDSVIKIWDSKTKKVIKNLKTTTSMIKKIILSSNKKTIAYINSDRKINIWNLETDKIKTLKGSSEKIYSLSFDPKGEKLVSAGNDGIIKLWSIDGVLLKILHGHKTAVYSLDFSSDGKQLVSLDTNGVGYLWNVETMNSQPIKEFISGKEGNWVVFDYTTSKKFLRRKDDGTFLMKKKDKTFSYMGATIK